VRTKIIPVLRRYGIDRASIFGSFARGEARDTSDIDLLIEPQRPLGVYALVRLKRELDEVVGRPVDVVTRRALNKHVAPFIVSELVSVL